tara:strand:+ start:4236 stop:4613 length:378 start_codon:yes stop_codon:yes gene_type:complete
MPEELKEAIEHVLDQYLEVERKHWEEDGANDDGHIYHSLAYLLMALRASNKIDKAFEATGLSEERVESAMNMYKDMVGIIANETHEQMAARVFRQHDLDIQNNNGLSDEDELRADLEDIEDEQQE